MAESELTIGISEQRVGASRRTYVAIGALLALVTIFEWQLPMLLGEGLRRLAVVSLLLLSGMKAALVVMFYMHLKFDSRVYVGILLLAALLVSYFLLLATLGFIWP